MNNEVKYVKLDIDDMKTKFALIMISFMLLIITLSGCEPIYPLGDLEE